MQRDPLTQINYATEQGREPFRHWLDQLAWDTRNRVRATVHRCANNPQLLDTKAKPLGDGLHEIRLHFGPGYRVYYTVVDGHLVLFGGSDKGDQEREIENAHNRLADWRSREKRL